MTSEPTNPAPQRATIFCEYHTFYWGATCYLDGVAYANRERTHGSARQAADEILAQVRARTGNAAASIRRLYAKQYELTVPSL
jgi:hypothetical protein